MLITISGQYGSGGNEVAARLAEILDYRVLDSQLIVRAREIYTDIGESAERPDWWPSLSLTPFNQEDDAPRIGSALWQAELDLKTDLLTTEKSFKNYGAETGNVRRAMLDSLTQAILEYVEDGNCILFGKCSDYILHGRPDTIHAFATADMEVRIERILNLYNLNSDKVKGTKWLSPSYTMQEAGHLLNMKHSDALELIYKTDKKRSDLFEFLTGEKWGDPKYYDFQLVGNDFDVEEQTNRFLTFIRERIG